MEEDQARSIDDPLYQALRDENIQAFNEAREKLEKLPSFAYGDFRGLDLRGLNAKDLDLRHAYFRGADLRGIDFSETSMEGASIAHTKISGCFFPRVIAADEIVMSLNHGTRMRYNTRG
ncbi:pentapeptide repeat-containing protein [Vreelandella utahensis]|uniref:pentapeptide repeat-containing protein n=1 Tax=Vreelandella halophila TaxID=86177 RepID=UPI0009877BBE|nr:pentapeptide repeat-containing protein [Halomonas utahensis]